LENAFLPPFVQEVQVVERTILDMSAVEALSAPLLLCAICEERESDVAFKEEAASCYTSSVSAAETQDSLRDTLCEISDNSKGSDASEARVASLDCMRADGLVHYPPDADADACASCALVYRALAERAYSAACAMACAVSACFRRVCAPLLSRMRAPYVP